MLKPLGDRIVIKALDAETQTSGGIILPETAQEKPQQGEVLAVGPGKMLDNGKFSTVDVQIGDKIVYAKYRGTEIKVGGEDVIILTAGDVMGVLN